VSVVVVVTAFPVPGHRAAVISAFEAAIKRVHWPTCGPRGTASSAPTSTRRSSSRTRPETRRRERCDRSSARARDGAVMGL